MKIIVVGLGQVGQEIAKEMIREKHDVTVIDLNKELVDKVLINGTNKAKKQAEETMRKVKESIKINYFE